ncbi:hypothetical protein JTB14_015862 [Gonioctena quinquepunctata]|nr:hypothetical protein JTB14_015862 [Gonioctena quinquepunctata]
MYNGLQERSVCKFNLRGMCRFGTRCWNLHDQPVEKQITKITPSQEEEICALGACALSPIQPKEKDNSNKENIYGPSTSTVEQAIALVKIAESEEKTCGICFDTIMKKVNKYEQTFGILPNCNHCFCFDCLKKWRKSREVELEVSKACPECRTTSDFVYPSKRWMENKS